MAIAVTGEKSTPHTCTKLLQITLNNVV